MIRRDEPDPGEGLQGCDRGCAREATNVTEYDERICADCAEEDAIRQAERASENRAKNYWSAA